MVIEFVNKLRFSNPWKYKAPLLICWPYLLILLSKTEPILAFYSILMAFSTLFGIAALGYFINDWADIRSDKKAGKPNKIGELKIGFRLLILCPLLLLSFAPWIWLPKNKYTYILLGIEILLFLCYSLPPFRLKEKGLLGILTDSLYAYIVPSILASLTFYLIGEEKYSTFPFLLIVISAWLFLVGVRGILLHQIQDYKNDLDANVKTFVTVKSVTSAEKIVRQLMPLELILLTGFFVFVVDDLWLLFPGYLVFCLGQWWVMKKNKEPFQMQDYRKLSYRFFDDFYLDILPILILLQLCLVDPYYLFILLVHIIFFRNQIKKWLLAIFKRVIR